MIIQVKKKNSSGLQVTEEKLALATKDPYSFLYLNLSEKIFKCLNLYNYEIDFITEGRNSSTSLFCFVFLFNYRCLFVI